MQTSISADLRHSSAAHPTGTALLAAEALVPQLRLSGPARRAGIVVDHAGTPARTPNEGQ